MLINKTVPNYSWTMTAFFVVLIWVASYTYLMSDSATLFGCTTDIPTFPMGLIFLAAGTSVPDLVASVSVARAGYADMAAANAIGGNTFKNFVGLGFPWLISAMYQGPTEVPAGELSEAMVLLAITLVLYVVAVRFNDWMLNRTIGAYMIIVYALGIIYCLIRNYTYFQYQNQEE